MIFSTREEIEVTCLVRVWSGHVHVDTVCRELAIRLIYMHSGQDLSNSFRQQV
jgi:hypothetical protein